MYYCTLQCTNQKNLGNHPELQLGVRLQIMYQMFMEFIRDWGGNPPLLSGDRK